MANSNWTDPLAREVAEGPNWQIARGLYLAPAVGLLGLFMDGPETSAAAGYFWVFSYAYCAPWVAYALRKQGPLTDHGLAGAMLALGLSAAGPLRGLSRHPEPT